MNMDALASGSRKVIRTYSPDIRYAYLAEMHLREDGYTRTSIVEQLEEGKCVGYHVWGERPEG
jgi:hypothetical protein